MPKIVVEVSRETAASLTELVRACGAADDASWGANTNGKLDVPGLLAMLAQDAAIVIDRPGSWEGA